MLPSHGSPNILNSLLNSLESAKFMSSNGLDCRLSHIVFNLEFGEFFESFIRKYCLILEFAWSLRPRDLGFVAPSAAAEIFPKLTNGSLSPVAKFFGFPAWISRFSNPLSYQWEVWLYWFSSYIFKSIFLWFSARIYIEMIIIINRNKFLILALQ